MESGISPVLLGLLGVVALVAAGLAVVWRSADARANGLAADLESLRSEREELTARLSRERQARSQQAEELATLRKRVDKAKKRSARAEKGWFAPGFKPKATAKDWKAATLVAPLGGAEPGLLVVFAQDGRQLQLLQLMVQQDLRRLCHVEAPAVRHI